MIIWKCGKCFAILIQQKQTIKTLSKMKTTEKNQINEMLIFQFSLPKNLIKSMIHKNGRCVVTFLDDSPNRIFKVSNSQKNDKGESINNTFSLYGFHIGKTGKRALEVFSKIKATEKNIKNAKDNIVKILTAKMDVSDKQYPLLTKIEDAVNYAFENWDKKIIDTYKSKKEFVENWIENEDFEADGFDEKRIIKLFS